MTNRVRLSDRFYQPESEKQIDKKISAIKDNLINIENAIQIWHDYCNNGLTGQEWYDNIPECVNGLVDIAALKNKFKID